MDNHEFIQLDANDRLFVAFRTTTLRLSSVHAVLEPFRGAISVSVTSPECVHLR